MSKKLPTKEILEDLLEFQFDTGKIFWRKKETNRVKIGGEAGCNNRLGYKTIRIRGVLYMAHRLIWKAFTGNDPVFGIDHIDGDPSNNSIGNLREANQSQNMMNRWADRTNRSGMKGVYFHKSSKLWHARIQKSGVSLSLGYFHTPEEGHEAYVKASKEIHGEFSVFNRQ